MLKLNFWEANSQSSALFEQPIQLAFEHYHISGFVSFFFLFEHCWVFKGPIFYLLFFLNQGNTGVHGPLTMLLKQLSDDTCSLFYFSFKYDISVCMYKSYSTTRKSAELSNKLGQGMLLHEVTLGGCPSLGGWQIYLTPKKQWEKNAYRAFN